MKYSNCISLGWSCGTAASMAKCGLRSSSGPFDWYLSHLSSVMRQIEAGFTDFMQRENLEPFADDSKKFRDCKYDFEFLHDIENDLDTDYNEIVDKYKRRIVRFETQIKSPTIFFRSVRDVDEKVYIMKYYQNINAILKGFNPANKIIYLLPESMGEFPDGMDYFTLYIESYPFDEALIQDMFDHSLELLNF